MNSIFTLVVLWGAVTPQISRLSLRWEQDYGQARAAGTRDSKPLAVFVGRGADGWKQLVREGKLDGEARKSLTERFVAVYVDQDSDSGKQLAAAFGLGDKLGLIISDRTGGVMAFRHEGDLSVADLAKHLGRFSNPNYVTTTTEGNGAPPPPVAPTYVAPAAYQNPYGNPYACQT